MLKLFLDNLISLAAKQFVRPVNSSPGQRLENQVSATHAARALQLSPLEPRVLYSASPVVDPGDMNAGVDASQVAESHAADFQASHLILIDSRIDDVTLLALDMARQSPDAEIVFLDSTNDPLTQLENLFSQYYDLARVELFSHGNSASLQIGEGFLDLADFQTLDRFALTVDGAMARDGELLLFGCDVASSKIVQSSLEYLAQKASIVVAASTDLTGSGQLGGDWDLEFVAGDFRDGSYSSEWQSLQWEGLLLETSATDSLPGQQETSSRDRGSDRSVAMHSDGSFVIVWSDDQIDGNGWGVAMQRYNAAGNAINPVVQVNNINTNSNQHWASVAMDASGNFVVTWTNEQGDRNIYARLFNNLGNPVTDEFRVNNQVIGEQINASVAMASDGTFVVTWQGDGPLDSNGIFTRRFDASGNPLTGDVLVNPASGSAQYDPSISINSSGKFLIGWDDIGGYHVQRFNANGSMDGGAITVSGNSSAGNGSVLLNNDNTFAVTWRETVFGTNASYVRVYDTANDTSVLPFLVGPLSSNDQVNPSIGGDGTGSFIITWEGDVSGQDDKGIFLRRFNANGFYASGVELVNTYTAGTQEMASVDVIAGNRYVVVWSGEGTGDANGVFFRQYAPPNNAPTITSQPAQTIIEDNSFVFSASNFGFNDVDGDLLASVRFEGVSGGLLLMDGAAIQAGDVVSIADINAGKVRFVPTRNLSGNAAAQVSFKVNDGTVFSSATGIFNFNIIAAADNVDVTWGDHWIPVNNGSIVNSTLLGEQSGQNMAALTGGGYVVVWASTDGYLADGDSGTRVMGQVYDANGNRVNLEFPIDNVSIGDQSQIRVTGLADGGFVAVWVATGLSNDIFAQRFDASGNFLNLDGSVSATAVPTIVNQYNIGFQNDVDVTATANGFALTWSSRDSNIVSDGYGIVARYIDLDGNMSAEFRVNQFDTGNQRAPRIASLNDHQLVVTWVNQNGVDFDIQGSILSLGSTVAGPEFSVNSLTAMRQAGAQVASLGDNGFVVVWQSENGDGTDYGVVARRFDIGGNPVDNSEFVVNARVAGVQFAPEVIGFADGSYTVLWQSTGRDGDTTYGIAQRTFNGGTGQFGPESLVNNPHAGQQTFVNAALLNNGQIGVVWNSTSGITTDPNFVSEVMLTTLGRAGLVSEDNFLPLNLSLGLVDGDGSETVTLVRLLQTPIGSEVTDGTNTVIQSSLTSIDITGWDLSQLTIRPPQNYTGQLELLLEITTNDGVSQKLTQSRLNIQINPVNDAIIKNDFGVTTAWNNVLTIATGQVVADLNDPDHVAATPPATTPLIEYLVNASTNGTPNGFSQIEWAAQSGSTPIVLSAPNSQLIGTPGSNAGDIRQAFDLQGSGGGTLNLASLSSGLVAFEIWINPDNLSQTSVLFEWGSSTNGLSLIQSGSSIRMAYTINGNVLGFPIPTIELVSSGLVAGQFNQIVGVIDSTGGLLGNSSLGDLALYVNGNLADAAQDVIGLPSLTAGSISGASGIGETIAGVGTANGSFASGAETTGAGSFDGQLGRLAVFDGGLDSNEIRNRFVAIQNAVEVVEIDGVAASGTGTVSLGSGALVSLMSDGSFEYDPNSKFDYLTAGQTATDSFTYSVADQTGIKTTVTVTVTVTGSANSLPTANPDNIGTINGSGPTIITLSSLLANDADLDSDTLSLLDFGQPQNGSLVDNGDGTLTYTPNSGYSGADSFQYTITDGKLGLTHFWNLDGGGIDTVGNNNAIINGTTQHVSGTGLQFLAANQDHVEIPDFIYGDNFTLSFGFNVDDLSGNGFRYAYSHGAPNEGIQIYFREAGAPFDPILTLATIVRDGNDTLDKNELNINAAGLTGGWHNYTLVVEKNVGAKVYIDGVLMASTIRGGDGIDPSGDAHVGTRSDHANGHFMEGGLSDFMVLGLAASDVHVAGLSSLIGSGTASVSLLNNLPPVTLDDTFSISEDAVLSGSVTSNDTDSDGGPLVYSLVSGPSLGTLVLQNDGTFTFDPRSDFQSLAKNQLATQQFVYRATDQYGAQSVATATVTIVGQNDNPILINPAQTLSYSLLEDQTLAGTGLLTNVTDIDGDPLNVRISAVSNPQRGSLTLNPDGTFVYTPDANYFGSDQFTYRVRDGQGGTLDIIANLTIASVNDAPIVTSSASVSVPERTTNIMFVTASDADGQTPQYSIAGSGADDLLFSIDPATGLLAFRAPQNWYPAADTNGDNIFEITVNVTDGVGGVTPQNIQVTLTNTPEGPIFSGPETFAIDEETFASMNLAAASDPDGDAITYSLAQTADASFFIIDTTTLTLVPLIALDFETPLDADRNNTYELQMVARDATGLTTTKSVTVTVRDVNDVSTGGNTGVGGTNGGSGSGGGSTTSDPGSGSSSNGESGEESSTPDGIPGAPPTTSGQNGGSDSTTSGGGKSLIAAQSADTRSNSLSSQDTADDFKGSFVEKTVYQAQSDRDKLKSFELISQFRDPGAQRAITSAGFEQNSEWFNGFLQALGDNRDEMMSDLQFQSPAVISTAAGLIAVGYLTWAVKSGGALLSAFVSSMPAWQSFDPLPVIESNYRRDDKNDKSIEQMVDSQA